MESKVAGLDWDLEKDEVVVLGRRKSGLILRFFGCLAVFLAACALLFFAQTLSGLLWFVETYLSPDGELHPGTVKLFGLYLAVLIAALLGFAVLLLTTLPGYLWFTLNRVFALEVLWRAVTVDPASSRQSGVLIFAVATALALGLQTYIIHFGHPPHEGRLEVVSSFGFLGAALILVFALRPLRRYEPLAQRQRRALAATLVALAASLFFVFGEENSWGQTWWGWESTAFFDEFNFQGEMTLHNFFNPVFKYVYAASGPFIIATLLALWVFPRNRDSHYYQLICPHPSLCLLALSMTSATFYGQGEVFEELLALFCLLYAVRVWLCLRFPAAGDTHLQQP